ncbi:hypothetical protein XI02_06650 [Bradyrhizobium sp. CCBAU 21365]|nr:hypothetical protein XI02_06650 [Bradyrhizobium sp. CCBAU 21365]
MLGNMSVSILSVGADAFQFIQGIESRYRIGGKRSMSPALALSRSGELSVPQAASDGSIKADASNAVIRRCMMRLSA